LDLITILWFILFITSIIIGIKFLSLYLKDKDKRKLMFSIGFFCNIITFITIFYGFHKTGFNNSQLYGLFGWGASPLVTALLFAVIERLFKLQEKINLIFKLFIILNTITFLFFLSGTAYTPIYTIYMSILSFSIIILSLSLIIKYKDLSSVLFLFSQIFFTISGITIGNLSNEELFISEYFPIFSFFVSFIFLYLIFVIPSNIDQDKSIKAYFSIKTQLKTTEDELKNIKERYISLFNSNFDMIYIYDSKGNFIDANNAALNYTGYTKDEIKNISFQTLLDKGQLLKANKMLREIKKTGTQKHPAEFRLKCKNGDLVDVEVVSTPIHHYGKIISYQGIARDITDRKKAEKILKISDEIVKSIPSGLFIYKFKSPDKLILEKGNHSAEKLTGIKASEWIGKEFNEIWPNAKKEGITDNYLNVMKTGKIYTTEDLHYKDEKIEGAFHINAFKLPSDRLAVAFDNITERKKAEEKTKEIQEYLQLQVERMPIGLIVWNKNFKVKTWNPAAEKIFGFSEKESLGKHPYDFIVPKVVQPVVDDIWNRLLKGDETANSVNENISKDGKTIICSWANTPLKKSDGTVIGVLSMVLDITERTKAEKDLKEAHESLQKMNQELEQKVKERTERITNLLNQKDIFINQLGHDLKNPLGPLLNLLPLLERKCTNKKEKEMFEILQRNVGYMKKLVVNTIELARLNSSNIKLNLEEINLYTLANDAIITNQYMFKENELDVELKIPKNIKINVDKLRIEELFHNLINNSIKYSPNGGKITIKASEENKMINVSIHDEGQGMTKEQLKFVFDEFYKADSSRHDFESSGLGMPIAQRIVEIHGGKIWAESQGLGKGSTFNFTLPNNNEVMDKEVIDEKSNIYDEIDKVINTKK
jgi:PAS domain S-box-containing protein